MEKMEKIEQIIKNSQTIKLHNYEKAQIKLGLINYMKEFEACPRLLFWRPIQALIALLIVIFVGGGITSAAERSLPGQVLYPVKTASEEVLGLLAFSREARADWELKRAERRLEEAEQLAAKHNLNDRVSANLQNKFRQHMEKANAHTATLAKTIKVKKAKEVVSRSETALKAHKEVLRDLSAAAPLLNEVEKRAQGAAQVLQALDKQIEVNRLAEVKEKVEQNRERIKKAKQESSKKDK